MGRIVGEKNNGYVHGVRDIVASFIVYGAKEYIPRHLKRGSSKPTARKSGLSLISLDLGENFASLCPFELSSTTLRFSYVEASQLSQQSLIDEATVKFTVCNAQFSLGML